MSVVQEPEGKWTPDQMVAVPLNEPDDFLKVRETLTRIGVASRKEKRYINPAIYFISKGGIFLSILKNSLPLTGNTLTLLLTMFSVATVLLNFLLIGDWLVL